MKAIAKIFVSAVLSALSMSGMAQEKLIVVNEGTWQGDNGRLSYFENGAVVSNKWFRDINGTKLGDTPNDIIQINDNLVAITVNTSNIVQFITPEGKAVGATEDIPNNRRLASDGRYVYVTSYGHECKVNGAMQSFTKGFVAKIDVSTLKVISAVEVGYEPEGIAYYRGYLFVANTGGYSATENDHEYERTVSVIDATTMKVTRTIDTGCINLYGRISQAGRYLCINSAGDYYETPAAGIIMDCEAVLEGKGDSECFATAEHAFTYSTADRRGRFMTVGSRYSYLTGEYTFSYLTIDPAAFVSSHGTSGITETLPDDVLADVKAMSAPYGLYVNPYTGYIYGTDAGAYTGAGALYQWSPEGKRLGKHKLYINPGHFLALPPDGHFGGVGDIIADRPVRDDAIYNLQGIRVTNPEPGQIYIRSGRKFIYRNH